jgi:hypothetical protein
MVGNDGGNAMTEIALALAMAFFAIMILTMVSMGGKGSEFVAGRPAMAPRPIMERLPAGLRLLPSLTRPAADRRDGDERMVKPHQVIIFDGGGFLDDRLQPLDSARMAAMAQPVLAVPAELSLSQVMALKSRLDLPDLTITTLDRRWLAAIKEQQE